MTLSPWIIYLWGIADQLRTASACIFWPCGIVAVILIWFAVEEKCRKAFYCGCGFLAAAVVTGLMFSFIPSSKTVAVMVVAPAIVNSEPIQKDLPELYKAAKEALMGTLANKE